MRTFMIGCALVIGSLAGCGSEPAAGTASSAGSGADGGATDADADAGETDAGTSSVNAAALGPSCEDGGACPAEMRCVQLNVPGAPAAEHVCAPSDVCSIIACARGLQCLSLEKDPPIYYCGE